MDLSAGTERLSNRKRVQPATGRKKIVRPEIQPANLPTAVFGIDPNLQKEFDALSGDETIGIRVSNHEKEIISSKSLKQRKHLPEGEITDISYSIISHEELDKIAVFEVRNDSDTGLNSIGDPRGGTVESNVMCSTCNLDNLECPGHLGIIKLNEHIIHPMFRREVVDILMSICGSCGGLLLPIETIREKGFLNLTGSKRLRAIAEESEKVPCRRNMKKEVEKDILPCIPNPIYRTSKLKETGKIFYTHDEKSKTSDNIRTVDEIETIFNSISTEDAEILGFSHDSHPSRFIMKSLPVIPLCARAPVYQDGEIMKDDLTNIYKDITRINNFLATDLKEAEKEEKVKNLVFKIEHMFNNSDKKYSQSKKKAYESIKERIQGKEALIRSSLMGKRVNYTARTVIGPDPTLKFGQIRVPRVFAPYLTQHEIVTPENLKKMTNLLREGKITHIIRSSGKLEGKRIKVNEKIQKEHTLSIGDEVDRYLENGDWLAYNRQPTLQKQGFMGYEVVLGDTLTIGLHLGYTRQHNAD